ncbi:MAG: DUF72 domain-containing protein [Bacillota bacterium]
MKTKQGYSRGKIWIGTSGWTYGHWQQLFYPAGLPAKERLPYYVRHFLTTEVNYSFYHLPRPSTYCKWYSETPAGFVFAVKASRFITHVKKLQGVQEAWAKFIESARHLQEKLGPVLFQFPPGFPAKDGEVQILREFLELITAGPGRESEAGGKFGPGRELRFAFEFRHQSWCCREVYELLREYNAAWVIADSARYPKAKAVTADFVYVRMHGPQAMFGSAYSKEEINELAREVKEWSAAGLDVYVYFNNDFHGYAVANARNLMRKLPGD